MTPTAAKTRLSREDWLAAAEAVLADRGAGALKAEPLARHMQTTKGSFYWHFRDVPDLHAQVLARWEAAAMAATDAAATEAGSAAARLRALAQALADPGPG
ncbi:MAG: TetR/AcrR family transcriptional regulator, partial [Roseovarius sp.]|nr:TetR/AcrR family transcriptional regulator [Roseovarius sp.]